MSIALRSVLLWNTDKGPFMFTIWSVEATYLQTRLQQIYFLQSVNLTQVSKKAKKSLKIMPLYSGYTIVDYSGYWRLYGGAKTYIKIWSGCRKDAPPCPGQLKFHSSLKVLPTSQVILGDLGLYQSRWTLSCLMPLGWVHGQRHSQNRGGSSWPIRTTDQGGFFYPWFDSSLF